MIKLELKFKQLPDPMSRYEVVKSDHPYLLLTESVMDPYPYFFDKRYKVTIVKQNGKEERNWRD